MTQIPVGAARQLSEIIVTLRRKISTKKPYSVRKEPFQEIH